MTIEKDNQENSCKEEIIIPINDFIEKICNLYQPTEDLKEADLFSTNEIKEKIASIIPEMEISSLEIKEALEKAGFIYKSIKTEGDFNFYWLMKEK